MAPPRKRHKGRFMLAMVLHIASLSIGIIASVVALVFLVVYLMDRINGVHAPQFWQAFFYYALVGAMFLCIDYLVWHYYLKRNFS